MPEDVSPYLPPAPPEGNFPLPLTGPPSPPPGQIKVLAILHLVFAGLGLVTLIFGVFSQKMSESVIAMQEKAGGVQAAQAQISRGIVEASKEATWFGYLSSLVLGAMLLIAGLALLKGRKSGLAWSNRYAWTSILFKITNLILFFTLIQPKLNQLFSAMDGGGKEMEMVRSITKASTTVGGAIGPIFACIYPVLVLILLNRESVRKALV